MTVVGVVAVTVVAVVAEVVVLLVFVGSAAFVGGGVGGGIGGVVPALAGGGAGAGDMQLLLLLYPAKRLGCPPRSPPLTLEKSTIDQPPLKPNI